MNAPTGRLKRPVVLVVDDVEGNRQLVCRRLADHGYDLHQVESGEQALDFIRNSKPDLVLLDYMMPNMNGIEVLRIVRQDWQMAGIPIIMLTARAEGEAVVEALEAGADDYVTKPIDFEVLKARIETQMAKHRSSDQLRQTNAALDERATMRVLAFDELRDELEREIGQRRQLERQLAEAQRQLAQCGACGSHPGNGARMVSLTAERPPAANGDTGGQSARALEIIDAITRSVETGKSVNPALLSALRMQVNALAGG
ncbi:response regulator [Novosphingobium sp. FSY-8]|uniref:Response regulator n=1 Tax=Novosphingobium ovatum TaxID=1908523 RepID=A0ABW9XF58_9SPHN|nr:response regulator [Novosphingobium ovatum]NBC37118.1 response regulator [Novosphingobium ovatum]